MSEVSYPFVTLSYGCQKRLSHFRLLVIYNTNAFYFYTFITLFHKLLSLGSIRSKCSELIRCINIFKNIKKNALGCMNVVLLHVNRRHVSATHVAILRVLRPRIQRTHHFIYIPLFATLKMANWMAETCQWLLCNIIAFIHPSAFVGLFKKFCAFFIHSFVFSSGCQNAFKFVRLVLYVKNALIFLCIWSYV